MGKDFPGMTCRRFPGNFPPGKNRETSLLPYKQTNNIFLISHSQKFRTIIHVYGWGYEKKSHSKTVQNPNSCSYLKFIYFRVEILYRWLGWSNFKILSFGKAHMVRKDPNFWYLMKKSSCQKSVQKKCKSAGALSLKDWKTN